MNRALYPPLEPYAQGELTVSDLHTLYYEQAGNPEGCPVVFLHGGPGGGCEPLHRRFFDPARWRIVLFDQRGCGRSRPHAEVRDNTTWDLVADIELLRTHLGIAQWTVFGGSWGSTLALAYSQTHPAVCQGLILRGIFLLRQSELQWFYQHGASQIFPDAWAEYRDFIPATERHDMLMAYHRRLFSEDAAVRLAAAQAWSRWEAATCKLQQDRDLIAHFSVNHFAEAFARIENHYFVNRGFFTSDTQLLDNLDTIRHLPIVIVQGRYDVVCPPVSARELHEALPEAEFHLIADAGHAVTEPGISTALLNATDRFAGLFG